MTIRVYQGEEYYVDDNLFLGALKLAVPKKRAGEAYVKVTYIYDINGILQVEVENEEGDKKEVMFLNDKLDKQEQKQYLEDIEKILLVSVERLFLQLLKKK